MLLLHCPNWVAPNIWQVLFQHSYLVQDKTGKQTSNAAGNSDCWEG